MQRRPAEEVRLLLAQAVEMHPEPVEGRASTGTARITTLNRDEVQLTATAIESRILAAMSAMAGKNQQWTGWWKLLDEHPS
jgi:hypothetical protein